MNVLVTGARGTLGRPLVRALKVAGHRVFQIDLMHSEQPDYYRADIGRYLELERVLYQIPLLDLTVYNLAAEFGRHNGEEYHERCWNTNVVGLKNLLLLQRQHRFRLIHFSSSEIYGELDLPRIAESTAETIALFPTNDYAISKLANEHQIRNERALYNTQTMIVRLFNAYGPGEFYHPYRSVVCLFCYCLLKGLPIQVFKDYHRVFMYIDDLIPTLVRCLERFEDGLIVNIGGKEYRSVEELLSVVRASVGPSSSEISYLEVDNHNVKNKCPDITQAEHRLDHNPTTTLEEGVPKTVAWLRDVYRLPGGP